MISGAGERTSTDDIPSYTRLLNRILPSSKSLSTVHPRFVSQDHISGKRDGMVQTVATPEYFENKESVIRCRAPVLLCDGDTPANQICKLSVAPLDSGKA